jgi:hypothetical protein
MMLEGWGDGLGRWGDVSLQTDSRIEYMDGWGKIVLAVEERTMNFEPDEL